MLLKKVEDLQNIGNQFNLDLEILSMEDIGWDRGEIATEDIIQKEY